MAIEGGHCRDCRHWDRSVVAAGPRGLCRKIGDDQRSDAGAIAVYTASDGWTGFMSGPDFGCVLFEPIPTCEICGCNLARNSLNRMCGMCVMTVLINTVPGEDDE